MVWTPPTKPDPGIATPTEVVAADIEMAGAAYRVQPGRESSVQGQVPYYDGFVRVKNAYGQSDINMPHSAVGVDGASPPPDKPVGDHRPRATKDDAPVGGTSHRTNVQSNRETSGEAPAPLFTQAATRR